MEKRLHIPKPVLAPEMADLIRGSLAELDHAQLAVLQTQTPAQKFFYGASISTLGRRVTGYREEARKSNLRQLSEKAPDYETSGDEEHKMNSSNLDFSSFIRLVLEAVEAAEIDYMIGGAIAAWAWGEPRATMDLDLIIHLPVEKVSLFSQELEKRAMLVPADIILDHLLDERSDLPLSAVHMYSGYKADIYLYKAGDELRRSAFARRQEMDLGPEIGTVFLHSPEDLILYKLWYFSLSRQTKHTRDIGAILAILGNKLDIVYLESWVKHLGLTSTWEEISGGFFYG